MEKTLNSDIGDAEKAHLYIEMLRKYKHFDSSSPLAEKKTDEKLSEMDMLATVLVNQRHRAKRLLEHLKRDSSIKIGDRGELIHNQQKLEHSHVGDLLNDILQKKSSSAASPPPPEGLKKFR